MTTTLIATLTLGLLQAAPAQPPATAPAPTPAPEPTGSVDPYTAPAEPAPAPAPEPAQIGVLYTPDSAPVVPPPNLVAAEQLDALKYRRLVFSNFYTLNLGMYPIPSGELSLFLGTTLRPRKSPSGTDWNTAIGYQLTLSLGYADYFFSESQPIQDRVSDDVFFRRDPIFFHRHALLAQGHGGRNDRLYYAMGGGAVMWHTLLIGVEAEGRIGYIFSTREDSRTRGILGGQLRLGGPFDHFPLPQFGAFVGFMVF